VVTRAGFPQRYGKEQEHTWQEWSQALNTQFSPASIAITGGEPALFPGLISLIESLDPKHSVIVTTNLSQLPDEWLRCRRKFRVSASFHPDMTDLHSFRERVLRLRDAGFPVAVECVAYPGHLDKIPAFRQAFSAEAGVDMRVDPYISPDYEYTPAEKAALERLGIAGRRFGFDRRGSNVWKRCWAGSRHFVVIPNGDVYACHASFYFLESPLHRGIKVPREQFYLGNVFQGTFAPCSSRRRCRFPCSEACDLDGAEVVEERKTNCQGKVRDTSEQGPQSEGKQ